MRPDQSARREMLEQGLAAVANRRKGVDEALIDWAEERGLVEDIGRRSPWGNRNVMYRESERDEVCDKFKQDLAGNTELAAALPTLKGKLLVCWCHPKRCHGHHLAALVNGTDEHQPGQAPR